MGKCIDNCDTKIKHDQRIETDKVNGNVQFNTDIDEESAVNKRLTNNRYRYLSLMYEHFVVSLLIATIFYLVFGMFIFSLLEGDNAERIQAAMKTADEFAQDYLGLYASFSYIANKGAFPFMYLCW